MNLSHTTLLSMLCMACLACHENIGQTKTATNPYPGNPDENFAPYLVKDHGYRNLALLKSAYASSSWDYNLTAQLATDGIIDNTVPAYFTLSTSRGPVPRNEREWMFDMKVNTGCKLYGNEDYFQLDLHNYTLQFDTIQVMCRVRPAEKQRPYYGVPGQEDGAINPVKRFMQWRNIKWKMSLLGSGDGEIWQPLDSIEGTGPFIYRALSKKGEYGHYRLAFSSADAGTWEVSDWDFFCAGDTLQRITGSRTDIHRKDILRPLTPPFNSCWMSGTGENQWLYVDLGTEASVERVVTHWIGDVPAGNIEFSNDLENWAHAGQIAADVTAKGKTRYVKLSLEKGGPYFLSEIEVFGRDGIMTVAKEQPEPTECRQELAGGNWRLQKAALVADCGESISDGGFDDTGWITATVPGTVLSSYINIGAVPDPNYSDNQLQISDSYFAGDFWYRDSFTLPESFDGKNIFLNFDGINWKAEVYLNGKHIGNINGAFRRGIFDIGNCLHKGTNYLAIKVLGTPLPGCIKEQTAESTDSNGGVLGAWNPTFHASVGWDWIPTIRGRNTGIWNDVYLTAVGDVRIYDPFVRTELNLPDTTVATVFAEVYVENLSDSPINGRVEGQFGETDFGKDVELAARETRIVRIDSFSVENPMLWWPAGYGKQDLYRTEIAFVTDGRKTDMTTFYSGVRQMTYTFDSVGALNMYINGRRFIGRGGNWGFSESNLRYRGREYDIAVGYHADMNFTMIRNWVGQTADEEFYEACDRHGIMVWQDFWLANPWDGPDPYDETMFMDNALDYTKRIRNHPSVGLYCGRNEAMPPATLDKALRELVADTHPGIVYISHSAAGEVSGGGPYRALPPESYFDLAGADRTHSERGMPNVMNFENLAKTIPADYLFPQTSLWGMHDFTLESAQYGKSFNELLRKGFGDMDNIHTFCKYAQWINYDGYRAMFEGRSKHRQGLLLWMSHPCWPSLVWQTYDYFFEPTAAYFGCKKACEPLHVQFNPLTGHVEIVNTCGRYRDSLEVVATIFDLAGQRLWENRMVTDSDEDSTVGCMAVVVPEEIPEVYFIRLELYDDGKLLSDNFYWQGREKGNFRAVRELPDPQLDVETSYTKGDRWTATTRVRNTSQTPALMLRVKLAGDDGELILPVIYSDNYFSLMPGESRTVTTTFTASDLGGKTPTITIE